MGAEGDGQEEAEMWDDAGDLGQICGMKPMPIGNMFICDTRSHIEHNNSTLTLNVISIAKTTKLFLSCRVPAVKLQHTPVSVEIKASHLNTQEQMLFV